MDKVEPIDMAFYDGWNACLHSIVASLKMYPNGGGDIAIMAEVNRLIRENRTPRYRDTLCSSMDWEDQ